VRLLLVGVHEGLGIFENEWKMLPQQFAITEVCLKEWTNHFLGAFIIVLTITAVTLSTSVMISDYSDYLMRIFSD
jgi:hypothetical protein